MEPQIHSVGERVDKHCDVCEEKQGHVVATVTKRGQISRVVCSKCGTRSALRRGTAVTGERTKVTSGAPYNWTHTYRRGQTMLHPVYGFGEVTAIIEPQKIDVLFADRMRRLIHSRPQT